MQFTSNLSLGKRNMLAKGWHDRPLGGVLGLKEALGPTFVNGGRWWPNGWIDHPVQLGPMCSRGHGRLVQKFHPNPPRRVAAMGVQTLAQVNFDRKIATMRVWWRNA